MRLGLETFDLTAARLTELGLEGFMAPIKASCKDHEGGGGIFVQQWNGSSWDEYKVLPYDGAESDYFGCSVSISADGKVFAAGAYADDGPVHLAGSVYVYMTDIATW